MPRMVGHMDAQHQALHYNENIKQQLHQQFAQQHEVDVHLTELLSAGGGRLVADQHIPLFQTMPRAARRRRLEAATQAGQPVPRVTRGGEFAATQAGRPVPRVRRGGEIAATQAGQPVPRVRRGGEIVSSQAGHLDEAAGGDGVGVLTQLGPPDMAGGGVTQLVHPVPAAIIDPYSQSSVGPEPLTSASLQDHFKEEHYHSDMEPHPESSLMPFDPNLVCPVCSQNFRKGEIQKFRHHVKYSCAT